MINIGIVRDNEGFIWEFKVEGHAGYDATGNDIVCAAISALSYTAIAALDDVADVDFNYTVDDSGFIKCDIPADIPGEKKPDVRVILETIAVGFKQIELSYGEYVSVLDEEV